MLRNVSLCGVGGQGVLLVSRLIADAALRSGFDVRRSEVHGMSQRGGSVVSQVRYGVRVHSPLIPAGASDVLVALELLEALRNVPALRSDGILIANDLRVQPVSSGPGAVAYPVDVRDLCEATVERSIIISATDIAVGLGERRAANTVMLGAFSTFAPEIDEAAWESCIRELFRPARQDVNLEAFRAGQALCASAFPELAAAP